MQRPLLLLLISAAVLSASPPAATPARDHVLLITIDDLNDWVGGLGGHPQASTPHFDRLAKRGVLFTNAHCQAPICKPSRTSFMSGLRPSTTGVYGNHVEHDSRGRLTPGKDVPWLPLRFQQAGYQTYAAGKLLHHGNQGLGEILAPATGQGPYPEKKMNVPAEVTPKGIWDYGPWPKQENFTDWKMAQWTIDHIAEPLDENATPRFLSLGFYRPHVPLFAPPKWFDAAPKPEDIILAPAPPDDIDDLPAIARRMYSRVSFQAP
ncbi:MAG TPA: sulfatase-like hydrolase/transferase, partial [Luteolibacter sp.]|nr:sulfatase-like hydrolase/transferase [Luteolibacter sp.]